MSVARAAGVGSKTARGRSHVTDAYKYLCKLRPLTLQTLDSARALPVQPEYVLACLTLATVVQRRLIGQPPLRHFKCEELGESQVGDSAQRSRGQGAGSPKSRRGTSLGAKEGNMYRDCYTHANTSIPGFYLA